MNKMKKITLSILFLGAIVTVNAQSDVMKTSEVKKTVRVNEKGEAYETKVKVITEKTQRTQFDPNQKHQLNQDRIETPVTVERTIMIDNDMDPFYDKKTEIQYFNHNGKKYDFFIDNDNVLITYRIDDKKVNSAKAYKSKNNRFYIITGDEFNGIGYFNKSNDFVVEYYDNVSNDVGYAVFESIEM